MGDGGDGGGDGSFVLEFRTGLTGRGRTRRVQSSGSSAASVVGSREGGGFEGGAWEMSGDGLGVDPPIFEGEIPVRVKHNDLDERQALLTLRISCEAQRPSSSHKVLRCRLTDEEDPFLLFTLDLNEEEFAPLKHEQRLLIDFTAFPTKLVELLQHCHEAASQHDPR